MSKTINAVFVALALAVGAGPAIAQQSAPAAGADPAVAQPAPPADLIDFDCGQYLKALEVANPGDKPDEERQAQAVSAQDALAEAMLWVHGFTSGRSGRPPEPLTRPWMVDMVGKVAKACRTNSVDGKMRVADAVAKM